MKPRSVTIVCLLALLLAIAVHAADKPERDLISVEFKEINEKGYPVVKLINKTGKDIDDVSGGFVMEDLEGNILFSTGQTEAVPNSVFLAADATMEGSPFGLNRREALMEQLRSNPGSVRFFFTVRTMKFMDGSEVSFGS